MSLLERVRAVLQKSFVARHDSPLLLTRIQDGLDEEALWIGFARRFAPYKRAHLMFKDPERLRSILQSEDRPVRILVAGKAHPRDEHGQRILREIVELTRRDEYAGHVIFVEEYDIDLARAMVQGVDVWLNTPTRMLEASGTSGMKAAANASINLSIADGWWAEGARGKNGWTIAGPRVYEDPELQDQLDSGTLYRMLEEEIAPLYFQRNASGLPLAWIERMRESLSTIPPRFNTDRMVREYHDKAYARLAVASAELLRGGHAALKQSAAERSRVRKGFGEIEIVSARIADLAELRVGDPIDVHVEVKLGALRASDVVVELVFGDARERRDLSNATHLALRPTSSPDAPIQSFEGSHPMERSGGFAYGIRVRPSLAVEDGDSLQDLVLWA
jgi:glucan phosphorylase